MPKSPLVLVLVCAIAGSPASSLGNPPSIGTIYAHTDYRADVVMVSGSAGRSVARYRHRPWGDRDARTLGRLEVRRSFGNWEQDGVSGMFYAKARYYDLQQGRFLSVDPEGQAVYVALGGAPLEVVDPHGRTWFRIRGSTGRPAFRRSPHNENIFEAIPGEMLVEVGPKNVKLSTDVFIHTGKERITGWDGRIFSGMTRSYIGTNHRSIVKAWAKRQRTGEKREWELCHSPFQWVKRNCLRGVEPDPLDHAGSGTPSPASGRSVVADTRAVTSTSHLPHPRRSSGIVAWRDTPEVTWRYRPGGEMPVVSGNVGGVTRPSPVGTGAVAAYASAHEAAHVVWRPGRDLWPFPRDMPDMPNRDRMLGEWKWGPR